MSIAIVFLTGVCFTTRVVAFISEIKYKMYLLLCCHGTVFLF
jgi:hypothetical protein